MSPEEQDVMRSEVLAAGDAMEREFRIASYVVCLRECRIENGLIRKGLNPVYRTSKTVRTGYGETFAVGSNPGENGILIPQGENYPAVDAKHIMIDLETDYVAMHENAKTAVMLMKVDGSEHLHESRSLESHQNCIFAFDDNNTNHVDVVFPWNDPRFMLEIFRKGVV